MKYYRSTHGMNWITQVKRLAIYLRDGMACAYCGQSVEDGARLTLDHIRPRRKGINNRETNLVTACRRCNDSKNSRPVDEFAIAVAAYVNHGLVPDEIVAHVKACARRKLAPFIAEARHLIDERGSASKAVAALR